MGLGELLKKLTRAHARLLSQDGLGAAAVTGVFSKCSQLLPFRKEEVAIFSRKRKKGHRKGSK